MHVQVGRTPTSIGTFRYDVHAAGRSTHGYRRTPAEAHAAAREDGAMLYSCAQSERLMRELDEEKEVHE